jgi:hypothetical protein
MNGWKAFSAGFGWQFNERATKSDSPLKKNEWFKLKPYQHNKRPTKLIWEQRQVIVPQGKSTIPIQNWMIPEDKGKPGVDTKFYQRQFVN